MASINELYNEIIYKFLILSSDCICKNDIIEILLIINSRISDYVQLNFFILSTVSIQLLLLFRVFC